MTIPKTSTECASAKTSIPPREIEIDGKFYRYTYHKTLARGVVRMKCSYHRNDNCKGCSAYVKITPKDDGTEVIISEGSHAEACEAMNGRKVQVTGGAKDCTIAMKQFIEERCVSDKHRTDLPDKIWNDTTEHFRNKVGSNFTGINKNQARTFVYSTRERSFGGDVISKVEQLFSGSEDKAFLREHRSFVDKDGMQRMMCFSLPMLLALLKYPKVRIVLSYYQQMFSLSTSQPCFMFHRFKFLLIAPTALYRIHFINASLLWCLTWVVGSTFLARGF